MSIIGWIIFGLIVGVVAKLVMPGRDPGGIIVTILLGIGERLSAGFWVAFSDGTVKAIRSALSWP